MVGPCTEVVGMVLLSIRDLYVGYRTVMGELHVLDDINLDVDKGEIVASSVRAAQASQPLARQ